MLQLKRKLRFRQLVCYIMVWMLLCSNIMCTYAEESETQNEASKAAVDIQAESAILLEADTGEVIFEKNSDIQLPPASITKIMTLILIFEAIDEGKVNYDEIVTVSEYAASMGGSQVFLEPMEQQTVDTMIKCIAVVSANDACVAMAEHIAGTEDAFVNKMNDKARKLGMTNTNFINCCGLDTDGHITTARDVAIMSRELITKHPEIFNYTKIWMENITHVTRKGTSEFGLTNTNKLIKQYKYATGLKTGSTSKAKYCVSATAKKDNVELIAVVMAAPDYKVRFKDASTLLDYGFANCSVYTDDNMPKLNKQKVIGGVSEEVEIDYADKFSYMIIGNADFSNIKSKVYINKITAPVEKGDIVGEISYYNNNEKIGSVNIIAKKSVRKAKFADSLYMILKQMI